MNSGQRMTRELLRQYRRVTVMGLGRFGGGAGAARYFANLGAEVTVTDMAGADKLSQSVASLADAPIRQLVLGKHRMEDFTQADLVIANQAVRPENPFLTAARAAGIPVTTETGLALSLNRSPWLAVTGSSGKSTTSALLAAMLQAHDPAVLFGGNIGGDLISRVEDRPAASPLVVELSSFQLTYLAGDFAAGRVPPPLAAAVTNISPNHLDWHRDMEEYAEAKRALIGRQTPADWTILNVEDARLREWAAAARSRVIRCAIAAPGYADACFVDGGNVTLRLSGAVVLTLPLERFGLYGRHNVQNALQAVAAAFAVCGDGNAVLTGFSGFPGLPHRLERVGEVNGRVFVNDSKSTTPEAAITALAAIDAPKVLIAGGYDKHSPFEELGAAIQERAAGLILLGEAGPRLRRAVQAAASRRAAAMGELAILDDGTDFAEAVAAAYRLTPQGGVVLLSPACASYGMFVNYEERGRRFAEIAAALEK